jgi:hypothetical protein
MAEPHETESLQNTLYSSTVTIEQFQLVQKAREIQTS